MNEPIDKGMVDEEEIASMLRAYEGPDRPTPAARSPRTRRLTFALGAVAASVAAGLGAVALLGGLSEDDSGGCPEALVFEGRPYVGADIQDRQDVRSGRAVGVAREGVCADEGGEMPTGGESVRVSAVRGFPIEVALVASKRPDVVYIARGRCANTPGWDGMVACLRRRLLLDGRHYSAVRISGDLGPAPKQAGGVLLATVVSEVSERKVWVRPIEGVKPQRAVALDGDPRRIFVADGECYVATVEALRACLGDEG